MRVIEFLAMLGCSAVKKLPLYFAFLNVGLAGFYISCPEALAASGWVRTPFIIGYAAVVVICCLLIRPFERMGDKLMAKLTILSKARHAVIPYNSAWPLILCVIVAFLLSFVKGELMVSFYSFGLVKCLIPAAAKVFSIFNATVVAMWLYMVLEETTTYLNKDTQIIETDIT